MMNRFLLLIGFVASFNMVQAQQDPQFTVGQFHNLAYQNPAVVGSHDAICATMLTRLQWVGFGGEPKTTLFTAQGPFSLLNKSHGAGLTFMSDQLGQESTLIIKGSYAYRMALGPGTLAIGTSFGYISKTLGSDWKASEGTDFDPRIPINGATEGGFDMDFGLFYKIPNKLSIGISTTHLTASKFSKDVESPLAPTQDGRLFNYQIDRTFYLSAQYETPIGSSGDFVLKPGLFVKSDFASTTFALGGIMEYQEKFWGGLDYRLQDAVAIIAGANFQMNGTSMGGGLLKVGYSYDFTTSNINKFSSGSHEIYVRYCFTIAPQPKIESHKTVRKL